MNSLQKPIQQMTKKEVREIIRGIWTAQILQIRQFRPDSPEIAVLKEFIPLVEGILEELVNLSQLIPKPKLRFELIKNSGKLLFINELTNLLELDTVTNRLKIMIFPMSLMGIITKSVFALASGKYDEYRMTEVSVSSLDKGEHGEYRRVEKVEERLVNYQVEFSVSHKHEQQAQEILYLINSAFGFGNISIHTKGLDNCLINFIELLVYYS